MAVKKTTTRTSTKCATKKSTKATGRKTTARKPVKRTGSRGTTKAKQGTKASPLHRLSR